MSAPHEAATAVHGGPGRTNIPPATQQPPRASGSDRRVVTLEQLSTRRLNVMRVGYAFLGFGLAIVKWPVLIQDVGSLPVMEGVVTCLLTAMSLLALLGLRYPARMLPILLFEVAWKVIWIAAVAVPHLLSGDMDAAIREVLFTCSFVVVIIAVVPWGYAWRRYARSPGDPWR
jgi:hypothetical protein